MLRNHRPQPVNRNWGPGPVNANLGLGPGSGAKQWAGGRGNTDILQITSIFVNYFYLKFKHSEAKVLAK